MVEAVVLASYAALDICNFLSPTNIKLMQFYQHRDQTLSELLIVTNSYYVSDILKTSMAKSTASTLYREAPDKRQ